MLLKMKSKMKKGKELGSDEYKRVRTVLKSVKKMEENEWLNRIMGFDF